MRMPRVSGSSRRKLPLLLSGLLSLSGCAAAPAYDTGRPAANPCRFIALKDYSPAFNHTLADELQAAPAGATWPGIVPDYMALRDAVRACQRG